MSIVIQFNMNYFLITFLIFFLSSCATTIVDSREIVPELYDQELKKGKIFVFSNHLDIRDINIRVNDEVRKMKHTDTQIFDLKQGQNSVFSFMIFAGNEQENCDDQAYTFNTEMFPEVETYYFLIQSVFDKNKILKTRCFKDFQVSEDIFLRQIDNPRSRNNEFIQDMTEDFIREFIF